MYLFLKDTYIHTSLMYSLLWSCKIIYLSKKLILRTVFKSEFISIHSLPNFELLFNYFPKPTTNGLSICFDSDGKVQFTQARVCVSTSIHTYKLKMCPLFVLMQTTNTFFNMINAAARVTSSPLQWEGMGGGRSHIIIRTHPQ